jgi:ParB-like chromosome segregation protein Spo0J
MKTETRTNEHRDPHQLKNHPLNIKLYKGSPPTPDFVASVKAHGILTPLLVTVDDVVISGHDRKNAARMAGLKEVPVVVLRDVTSPLDLEELLIVSNRQKQKDNETLAREAARLTEIETERAAERQKQNLKKGRESSVVAQAPQRETGESGKTRTKVAEALGVGEKKAGQLTETGRELEKAEAAGDEAKVADIKKGLEKSVAAGHKAATADKKPSVATITKDGKRTIAGPPYDAHGIEKAFGALARDIDTMARVSNLNNSPGHRQAITHLSKALDGFKGFVKDCDAVHARKAS